MALPISKKRKLEEAVIHQNPTPRKKSQKRNYSSSPSSTPSNDEFPAVDLADSDASPSSPHANNISPSTSSAQSSESGSDSENSISNISKRRTRKRNDPSAFSHSMSKILSSKLSASKRADPVLARSATAALANNELANIKLEKKARQKMREDRKQELEKGRVRDVLGTNGGFTDGEDGGRNAADVREQEKRLRKTAQKGVIKLFNAVRAAQVKGEEAMRMGGAAGRKKERVEEMSKKGFLALTAGGEAKVKNTAIEEA